MMELGKTLPSLRTRSRSLTEAEPEPEPRPVPFPVPAAAQPPPALALDQVIQWINPEEIPLHDLEEEEEEPLAGG